MFGGTGAARATMMEQLDTRSLTKASRWIHIGEVVEKRVNRDPSSGMIYTEVHLKVDKTLKGDSSPDVWIKVPGGRMRNIGMVVHGVASFSYGEKALVFLQEDRAKNPTLVGLAQGKFRIYRSLKDNEEMALFHAPASIEFVTRSQNGQVRHVVASQVERRIPLTSLIGEIRSAMATEGILAP
jgi:hypothetical protein